MYRPQAYSDQKLEWKTVLFGQLVKTIFSGCYGKNTLTTERRLRFSSQFQGTSRKLIEARTRANVTSMSRNRWQWLCTCQCSATSLLLMWSRTPKPRQWWDSQRKFPHTTINVIKTTPHRDHQKPFSQVILDVKLIIKITHPMGICVVPSLLRGWIEPNCKPCDWAVSIPKH